MKYYECKSSDNIFKYLQKHEKIFIVHIATAWNLKHVPFFLTNLYKIML